MKPVGNEYLQSSNAMKMSPDTSY